jgi:type IV pilus assembly protein PilM
MKADLFSQSGQVLSKISNALQSIPGVRSKTSVGLNLGSHSIKAVEIAYERPGVWKLLNIGTILLPENTVKDQKIENPIALYENIHRLKQTLQMDKKNVCMSVNDPRIIIKRISIEATRQSEVSDLIQWEAEQYLPYSIDEAILDYQIVSEPNSPKTEVIFAAIRKNIYEQYSECARTAGVTPSVVDLDHFALVNAFEASYHYPQNEACALVDFGASGCRAMIAKNGVPLFFGDLNLSGNNLTQAIAHALKINFDDAEMLKTTDSAQILPQEVLDMMDQSVQKFSSEIKGFLKKYYQTSAKTPVTGIIIAGGSARIPLLAEKVSRESGIQTQIFNPFHGITFDPEIFAQKTLDETGPIAAIAIGLAIRAREA